MDRMTALLSIGELASRTGLPVRTIRFYSDEGVVPPADRTEAGYRLYGPDALARLGLVRTLRDLGLDLATIRRVLEREVSLTDVAAAHAAALDAQIRVLRVQKAVLQAVARPWQRPEGAPEDAPTRPTVRRRAQADRRRLPRPHLRRPRHRARLRGPDALRRARAARRPDARAGRRVDRARRAGPGRGLPRDDPAHVRAALGVAGGRRGAATPDMRAAAARVAEKARRSSPRTAPRRRRSWPRSSPPSATTSTATQLADRLAVGTDARAERYWQLLAIINGWPPVPTTVPAVGVVHRRAARLGVSGRRVERAPEERLDRHPRGLVGERAEPQRRAAVIVLAHGRVDVDALEPRLLLRGAGGAALAVVARVDPEPPALDRPDDELVGGEGRARSRRAAPCTGRGRCGRRARARCAATTTRGRRAPSCPAAAASGRCPSPARPACRACAAASTP